MRLTMKQMQGLLRSKDNQYLKCLGVLYLRYTCPPKDLWKWYEPYIESEDIVQPSADKSVKMTFGEYCQMLLSDMHYYGTTLPRIPVPIERRLQVMLLLLGEKRKRRSANLKQLDRFAVGEKVRAIYADEVNEPAWYEAVIDAKATENDVEDGNFENKFWVTFPEYGNTECVDLGDMELRTSSTSSASAASDHDRSASNRGRDRSARSDRSSSFSRSRSRSADSRGRGREHRDGRGDRRDGRRRDRSPSYEHDRRHGRDRRDRTRSRSAEMRPADLMSKVLQSSRDVSTATGRDFCQRPTSYKRSLALKVDRYTVRKRSRSRSPERVPTGSKRDIAKPSRSPPPATVITAPAISEERAREQQEMRRKLLERYGDASAST